jgi:hypothetical protein
VLKLFQGISRAATLAAMFLFFVVLIAVSVIPRMAIAVMYGGRFEGVALAIDAFCIPLWNAIASTVEAIQKRTDEPVDAVFREDGLSIHPPGH